MRRGDNDCRVELRGYALFSHSTHVLTSLPEASVYPASFTELNRLVKVRTELASH
jgi:hypothetical protein